MFQSYLKYSRYHLVWEVCCEFSFIHWGSSYRPSFHCLTTSGDLNYCYWDSQLGGDLFGLPIRGFRSRGQDDTKYRDVITSGAETIPLRINLLVRNVLPCDDMLFSSERPLTIERVRGGGAFTFFMSRMSPYVPLSMSKWTLPCFPRPQS